MLFPGTNTFYTNGFALIGYSAYGIRWWMHHATNRFYRMGTADMLPPSQYRHMCVIEEYIRGAPIDAGEAPKPWLTDNDILTFIRWDMEDLSLWSLKQGEDDGSGLQS